MDARDEIRQRDREIGKFLRAARKSRGRSLHDIAEMLGVSYQQVQKYESGQNRISAGTLCFLLDELNLPTNTLPVTPKPDSNLDTELWLLADQVIGEIGKDRFRQFLRLFLDENVRKR